MATGKDLGLLSVGFAVVRELLHRRSWGRAVKVMPRSWGTQGRAGRQEWMHSTGWGLPRQLRKGMDKVTLIWEKSLPVTNWEGSSWVAVLPKPTFFSSVKFIELHSLTWTFAASVSPQLQFESLYVNTSRTKQPQTTENISSKNSQLIFRGQSDKLKNGYMCLCCLQAAKHFFRRTLLP